MTTKTPLIILLVTIRTMNEIRISPHIEHNADALIKTMSQLFICCSSCLKKNMMPKLSEKKRLRTKN